MRRSTTLMTTLFLFAAGGALAAPAPIDYRLVCTHDAEAVADGVVVGVATEVAGQLHVWLVDGWECDAPSVVLAVALHDEDVVFDVTVTIDDNDGVVTVTFSHDGIDGSSSGATALPQVAIEGMARAHTLRAAAFENRARGAETSAAAREAAGVAGRPEIGLVGDDEDDDDAGRPDRPDRPEPPARGRR